MSEGRNDNRPLEEQMHEALARDLLRRVTSGEATAAELNVARQFLKDNNIDGTPKKGNPLDSLVNNLPFPGKK